MKKVDYRARRKEDRELKRKKERKIMKRDGFDSIIWAKRKVSKEREVIKREENAQKAAAFNKKELLKLNKLKKKGSK